MKRPLAIVMNIQLGLAGLLLAGLPACGEAEANTPAVVDFRPDHDPVTRHRISNHGVTIESPASREFAH